VLLASSSALLAAGGGAAEPVVSDTARTAQSPGVRLQGVGSFQSPVFVTAPAGDSRRLFVVEREGRIRIRRAGRTLRRPFLDVSGLTDTEGERGLQSMAFAPDYARSGRVYLYLTDNGGDINILEYRRARGNPDRADPRSRRLVIRVEHSENTNHNGGQVAFGPDGLLYAALGDGGGSGDPLGAGQRGQSAVADHVAAGDRADSGLVGSLEDRVDVTGGLARLHPPGALEHAPAEVRARGAAPGDQIDLLDGALPHVCDR